MGSFFEYAGISVQRFRIIFNGDFKFRGHTYKVAQAGECVPCGVEWFRLRQTFRRLFFVGNSFAVAALRLVPLL